MSIDEIVKPLNEGKAVQRPHWQPNEYWILESGIVREYRDNERSTMYLTTLDLAATDWQVIDLRMLWSNPSINQERRKPS